MLSRLLTGGFLTGFAPAITIHPSEEEGMSTILSFDGQFLVNLCLQLLATCIVVFFLYKLLYKPVLKFLTDRKDRIAKNIEDAEKMLGDAGEKSKDIDARLENIEGERGEILESTRATAMERAEQIIEDARKEAELIKRRAENDIERERVKAADEIRRQIVEVSAIVAARYISQAIDKVAQEKLLDEVIEGLGDLTWSA